MKAPARTLSPPPQLAAQYLRMSTDHQRYSLENQAAAIAGYARAHGYAVCRTFEDAGKSGVTTRGRDGLKALISEVIGGEASFRTVLVLDVSRWGRFQDPDEAAHYEFLCAEAGVDVVYCAELFEPGPAGSILKQLKRIMAGEYSRQLSEKVSEGKQQQARRGCALGGAVPFGFVRQVFNADGSLGPALQPGERKSRMDQDVRYAWGPPDEVEVVRAIYSDYTRHRLSAEEIASRLNADGRLRRGRPWVGKQVMSVLRCELCAGDMVFGTRIARIGESQRTVPRSSWERRRVCRPMVAPALFRAAQERRQETNRRAKTDERMISDLRRLLKKHGRLSAGILHASPSCLGVTAYVRHFGTLSEAYRRAGCMARTSPPARSRNGGLLTRSDVLAGLRRLHDENGRISLKLIDADPRLPGRSWIKRNFGGLPQAYAEAGLSITHALQRPAPDAEKGASTSAPARSACEKAGAG